MNESTGSKDHRVELTLERYAEIMAHLRHFRAEPRYRVLARFAFSPERWSAEGNAWLQRIVQEAEDEGDDLTVRFGSVYARTRDRLRKEKPRLEEIGDIPSENASRNPDPSPQSSRATGLAPGAMSAWQVSADAAAREAPSDPAPPPAASGAGAPVQRFVPSYLLPGVETHAPGAVDDPAHLIDVDSTLQAVVDRGETLPFGLKTSPAFDEWLNTTPQRVPDLSREQGDEPDEDPLNATIALPIAGLDLGPALPFAGEPTAPIPAMPVELYASLCAALAAQPDRAPEILRRFGVSGEEAKRGLDLTWREVFVRSPEQFARWRAAYERFHQAIAGARSKPTS